MLRFHAVVLLHGGRGRHGHGVFGGQSQERGDRGPAGSASISSASSVSSLAASPSAPLILAFDTSSSTGSVALSRGEVLAGVRTFEADRGHSRKLLPAIEGILDDLGLHIGGVDLFATVIGPGSFTGLRVALACLRGLAGERPCFGALAPDVAAWAARGQAESTLAITDLFHGEVFAGVYGPDGARLSSHESGELESVLAALRPFIKPQSVAVGSALRRHHEAVETILPGINRFDLDEGLAPHLASLAFAQAAANPPQPAHELLPFYLRDPLTRGLLNPKPKPHDDAS